MLSAVNLLFLPFHERTTDEVHKFIPAKFSLEQGRYLFLELLVTRSTNIDKDLCYLVRRSSNIATSSRRPTDKTMTENDKKAERSRLLNKHKEERSALEKNLKKAKGMMKEKTQKDLADMEERHEAELAALDGADGGGAGPEASSTTSSKKKEEKVKLFPDRAW